MKVFITGSTGYVGRHLIEELCKKDYEIYALVRENSNADVLKKQGVKLFIGDIAKEESFACIPHQFDIIIHLAFSLFSKPDPDVNIKGFDNVLSFARHNLLKKFIFISSQLVYGSTPANEIIDENHPCNTTMVFGKQQLRAEKRLNELSYSENFSAIILRSSEIYGGIGGFFKGIQLDGYINGKIAMIGNGKNAISFTYIGDLVQAIISSIEKKDVKGQVYNINMPGVLTQNELVQLIKRKVKTKRIFRVPVFMAWIVATFAILIAKLKGRTPFMDYDIVKVAIMQSGARSTEKAKQMLDFKPKYQNIADGLIDSYFSKESL